MKAVVIHAAKDLRIEQREINALRDSEVQVDIEFGGICGSDLHYFNHGGFGAIRLRQPMVLGHEVSGIVKSLGKSASGLSVGDRVAISPSRPCHDCRFCTEGAFNHCLNMRFYGSAMPMPHIQGAFAQTLVAEASQCHVIAPSVAPELAAFAEPLAVALHALRRAGDIEGRRVLITGAGPIGALCLLAARAAGAGEVVVTDVLDPVLRLAEVQGADRTINVAKNANWTTDFAQDKGHFDVMFEASGNESALRAGLDVLRPKGVLVQVGLGGDVTLPQNLIVSKEIEMRGAFRFHEEFAQAVEAINSATLPLAPLLSAQFPMERAVEAFELASDRAQSMKVQLDFRP